MSFQEMIDATRSKGGQGQPMMAREQQQVQQMQAPQMQMQMQAPQMPPMPMNTMSQQVQQPPMIPYESQPSKVVAPTSTEPASAKSSGLCMKTEYRELLALVAIVAIVALPEAQQKISELGLLRDNKILKALATGVSVAAIFMIARKFLI